MDGLSCMSSSFNRDGNILPAGRFSFLFLLSPLLSGWQEDLCSVVYLLLLFVLHLESRYWFVALWNPIHSNPQGQLEQCGDAPGGKDTERGGSLKTGESSPANILQNRNVRTSTWHQCCGFESWDFLSSAYNNSKESVLEGVLTNSKCPV